MAEWSDYLVFDILCGLCFGRSLNIKEPGENPFKGIPKAIHSYMKIHLSSKIKKRSDLVGRADIVNFTRSPLLGLLLWLKPRGLNRLFEIISPPDIKAYFAFIEESVTARREAEEISEQLSEDGKEIRHDMFHFLFQAVDPDTGKQAYSRQELFAKANLLVIAGSDTTSVSLCSFFFYIVRKPGPYGKLVKEIRSTFDSVDEIGRGPKLSSCKYLRACVDETMRMTPAAPSELSRTVLAGGKIISGDFTPPVSPLAPQDGRAGAATSTATRMYTAQNAGS